jgi:hypothetical protein
LQRAAARILEAIYEQDFLKCSYGYRPGTGPQKAVQELTKEIQGKYSYIVEADIKGFFNNIDHQWLMEMLKQRIKDTAFLGLINKWLKAGILETDGKIIHPMLVSIKKLTTVLTKFFTTPRRCFVFIVIRIRITIFQTINKIFRRRSCGECG